MNDASVRNVIATCRTLNLTSLSSSYGVAATTIEELSAERDRLRGIIAECRTAMDAAAAYIGKHPPGLCQILQAAISRAETDISGGTKPREERK